MSQIDLVRMWKDDDYRRSLDPQLLQRLPAHPAGDINDWDVLDDADHDLIISTHSRIVDDCCL